MSGRQSLKPWIAVVPAITLNAALVYGAEPGAKPPENPAFRKADANRDGYVSTEEVKRLRLFERSFREADDNRDGKLDADEFIKAQAIDERLRAERFIDDSVITAKVKAALLKDLRLKGLAVSVETRHGTVLLSGFVNDPTQAQRAAEVAAGIEGVASVKNSLVVKT